MLVVMMRTPWTRAANGALIQLYIESCQKIDKEGLGDPGVESYSTI